METHIEYFYKLKGPFNAFWLISVGFLISFSHFLFSETFLASGSLSRMQFQIRDSSKKSWTYGMYVKGSFEAQGFNGHELLNITDQIKMIKKIHVASFQDSYPVILGTFCF